MTVFHPCWGCTERADCAVRKGVVAALRKQPVTTARIKCDLPFTKHFPPGSRVSVKVWDQADFQATSYTEGTPAKWVSATVVGASTKKRGKLLLNLDVPIYVNDDDTTSFTTAYPKDVRRRDEPRRECCSSCRRALVNETCGCRAHWDDR